MFFAEDIVAEMNKELDHMLAAAPEWLSEAARREIQGGRSVLRAMNIRCKIYFLVANQGRWRLPRPRAVAPPNRIIELWRVSKK